MARITISQGRQGVLALVQRGCALDDGAHTRLVDRGTHCECYITTPFSVLAMRRFHGCVDGGDSTVDGARLLDALRSASADATAQFDVTASPGGVFAWPGALPPGHDYQLVETIPGAAVQELVTAGRRLARQFSTVVGPPASLLSSPVITCSRDPHGATESDAPAAAPESNTPFEVVVPMRVLFAINALSFVPSPDAEPAARRLRVARSGRWNRVEAFYGAIYWHDEHDRLR